MLVVSCQKGPTRHAYSWQIGPFWQDTLDVCKGPKFGHHSACRWLSTWQCYGIGQHSADCKHMFSFMHLCKFLFCFVFAIVLLLHDEIIQSGQLETCSVKYQAVCIKVLPFINFISFMMQVFLARGNVPAESYNFFIDILLNTIRSVAQSYIWIILIWVFFPPVVFKTKVCALSCRNFPLSLYLLWIYLPRGKFNWPSGIVRGCLVTH